MYAGSLGINPGDYLNPDGSVSIGLMPTVDGLTAVGFGAGKMQNQTAILNGGTTALPQTSTSCASNCQGGSTASPAAPGAATLFKPANASEFSLLGDGVDINSVQDWISTGGGVTASTLTIPIGIFGVADVSTMLNTVAGLTTGGSVCTGNNGLNPLLQTCAAGSTASYAYITLDFSTTASGATVQSETFALINGLTQANILDGATAGTSSSVSNYSVNYFGTHYTVDSTMVWGPTAIVGGTANTSLILDAQELPVFAQFQSLYLKDVVITDTGSGTTNHEVLSAVSITPTPEPSTLLLLGAGLAVIGVSRFRQKTVKA
jgi:PEP-CTERM motif